MPRPIATERVVPEVGDPLLAAPAKNSSALRISNRHQAAANRCRMAHHIPNVAGHTPEKPVGCVYAHLECDQLHFQVSERLFPCLML